MANHGKRGLNPKLIDGEFYWINQTGFGTWVPARAMGDEKEGFCWWVLAHDRPLRAPEVRCWRGLMVQPRALPRRPSVDRKAA